MSPRNLDIDVARVFAPLEEHHRYKGAYGGRGSGKSHYFGSSMIEEHVCDPNTHSVCAREIQSSIKMSVKRLLEIKIKSLGLQDHFKIQEAEIRNRHGDGRIVFQGLQDHTADSIKSFESFDRVWVEEAQSLSKRSLDLLRPTIRKENSELWFSWNPRFKTDAIDVLFRTPGEELPDDSVIVEANYMDNPWFPTVLRKEMEYDKRRDYDKYVHVWLGGYEQHSEARVFSNYKIEEFEAPADAMFRFGADWGFSIDPTVMIRCYVIGKKLFIDYEAYKVGCEIDETPDLFSKIPESDLWPCRADSARPETISFMKRHGFPKMHAAVKGKNSVAEGIEFLKSFDIIVHPRCVHTIDELMLYSYLIDQQTGEVTNRLADKKNHVIDALRYACEAARRASNIVVVSEDYMPNPIANHW